MLSVDRAAFGYGGPNARPVVGPASFSIGPGVLGIVGPSGIGKTTLLKGVAGLLAPLAGTVASDARKHWFAPQTPALIPFRTGLENAVLARELDGALTASDLGDAVSLLALLGLGDAEAKLPSELSGGMLRRLALAQALLAQRPRVFLDEPFAEIDFRVRVLAETALRKSLRSDQTVILVSHDLDSVIAVADAILILQGPLPARVQVKSVHDLAGHLDGDSTARRASPRFAGAVAAAQRELWASWS
jgi:ABC-type nitrate/sulfonate/bicarbonate transport system ATPase subunit